jgi:hypothetical protein
VDHGDAKILTGTITPCTGISRTFTFAVTL